MIRPLNPKAKTILKVALSLAVVALVLFIWANARPVPIQVRVTFTGFTNLPAFTEFTNTPLQAYFCVSNAGKCSVSQEFVHHGEIKDQPHADIFGWAGWVELKRGEAKTIWLSPPTEIKREPTKRVDDRGSLVRSATNLEPWRLTLFFSKADWRLKLRRNPPGILRKVLEFVPAKWLEPTQIEVHSDWINGPEVMPVATNTAKAAHE